jgi:hypothetical protein
LQQCKCVLPAILNFCPACLQLWHFLFFISHVL